MVVTGRETDRLPDGHGIGGPGRRRGTDARSGTAAAVSGTGILVPGDVLVSRRTVARGRGRRARERRRRGRRDLFVRHAPLRTAEQTRNQADLAPRREAAPLRAGPGAPRAAQRAHEAGASRLHLAARLPDRRLHGVPRRHVDVRDSEQRRRGRLARDPRAGLAGGVRSPLATLVLATIPSVESVLGVLGSGLVLPARLK